MRVWFLAMAQLLALKQITVTVRCPISIQTMLFHYIPIRHSATLIISIYLAKQPLELKAVSNALAQYRLESDDGEASFVMP